jgi:hypothetical protein
MVKAELSYNPYLLETGIKFNGNKPKINSLVEKYQGVNLQSWIKNLPSIFYSEMNGWDFDLEFEGTKIDFNALQESFDAAEVSRESVRLFHKYELECVGQKRMEISDLLMWLENNSNRCFAFSDFMQNNSVLFDTDYTFIMINGPTDVSRMDEVTVENLSSIQELAQATLDNIPVLFYVTEQKRADFKRNLIDILNRPDVDTEQLFFCINADLNRLPGLMLGGQLGNTIGGVINSFAPNEQKSLSESSSISTTFENKAVTDMLSLIDESLNRTNEFDSYGMWNVAGYFISDDMSTSEIAASNYRSLMNGENTGREVSAINSWRSDFHNFQHLTTYLSRFVHPQFIYGGNLHTSAATSISGKEMGLHLGLPRATVPGLPVIEHAEFGKEVTSYQFIKKHELVKPEDKITLGKVFDLGQVTKKTVELDNRSMNMHTFITGSTGSGKSNTVYQILMELRQDKIPFLVVEPAKGEYKDVFGNLPDVSVFSTNPNIAQLINLNPFKFPESIHVLEHVDGLVEIFSVCWPMYDAMPAFFKDAILRSYEAVGWDLGSSGFEGETLEYPDFEILSSQLDYLIENSGYHSDIKSNYKGALLTRVKSLTVGLNKFIFTNAQTPYEQMFDQNCILDISRVKSGETKALIMGLVVYILNEYRADKKGESNSGLKHITVLEEAHNLLKNTSQGGSSELVGKSVEILTNTIAEIRTYGEGFIIVDQSPSAVDIAAIKNTNTKIVLRTPEENDRQAVGRSIGLTEDQVNEIAKLPSGVAVVYQNNWISPVLTMVDKADVVESKYVATNRTVIKPIKTARSEIVAALMQPWLKRNKLSAEVLLADVDILSLTRNTRKYIREAIDSYELFGGQLKYPINEISLLQKALIEVFALDEATFKQSDELRGLIKSQISGFSTSEIEEICYVLTLPNSADALKELTSKVEEQ